MTNNDENKILCMHATQKIVQMCRSEMIKSNVMQSANLLGEDGKELVKTAEFPKKVWTKTHVNCIVKQWGKFISSDESKIFVFDRIGRKYIRKRIGDYLHSNSIPQSMKRLLSVVKWYCMILESVDKICVINDNINPQNI